MIPTKLTISGSFGVLAGLGRDEITVDLDQLIPDDAVTVAIVGDNGSGKSTLFNLALTPWREPPMLPGTIYDEFGQTGLRELEFTHAGRRYRSRIEIKQTAKTKSQKCTLHMLADGGDWQPVTMPDKTVSDGKTKTYDACLEWLLGPRSLYYLAAFRAQNAPKLAEYDDPKGLMRDLLALDEPERLRDRARDVARELKREYATVQSVQERAGEQAELLTELRASIAEMESSLPQLIDNKTAASEAVALARAEFEQATAADADNIKIKQAREQIEKRIDDEVAAGRRRRAQAQADLENSEEKRRQELSRSTRTKTQLETTLASAINRKREAERIINQRDEISAAVKTADDLLQRVEQDESAIAEMRQQAQALAKLTGDQQAIDQQIKSVKREGLSLASRRGEFENRAAFINQVPCHGAPPYDACPALSEVHRATGEIKKLTVETDAKRAQLHKLIDDYKARSEQITALIAETEGLQKKESDLAAARHQLAAVQALAAKIDGIEQAEAAYNHAITDIEETKQAIQTEESEVKSRLEDISASIRVMTDRLAEAIDESQRSVDSLRAQLDEMPIPDASSVIAVARTRLQTAEQQLSTATGDAEDAHANLSQARARMKSIQEDIDSKSETIKQAKRLAAEISKWSMLAVGLQGVIDLSIEDAGPAIAATANRLLTEAYGPRFSVHIVTQREQVNGRLVECFDISVIDSESGLEASILQKSGGESVWLDKALGDAVGIYHQDAAGVHYECLFADEAEDGLTQERKSRFYQMDRAALAMGGYQRKFFISHNPDAWSMADAVIDMGQLTG